MPVKRIIILEQSFLLVHARNSRCILQRAFNWVCRNLPSDNLTFCHHRPFLPYILAAYFRTHITSPLHYQIPRLNNINNNIPSTVEIEYSLELIVFVLYIVLYAPAQLVQCSGSAIVSRSTRTHSAIVLFHSRSAFDWSFIKHTFLQHYYYNSLF